LASPIQVVQAGWYIQYLLDWKKFLAEFAKYQIPFLVSDDLMAGDFPSFITTQVFYGKQSDPDLNINELIEAVRSLNNRLICKP